MPEDLIARDRISENGIDQDAAAVMRENNQHLSLDLAHFDNVLPTQPAESLSEQLQQPVLVQDTVVAHVNMIAILHPCGGECTEEQKCQRRERKRLNLARAFREVVEDHRRGGE